MPQKLRIKVRCDIFVYLDANDDDEIGPTDLYPEELKEAEEAISTALSDCGTLVKIRELESAIININPL